MTPRATRVGILLLALCAACGSNDAPGGDVPAGPVLRLRLDGEGAVTCRLTSVGAKGAVESGPWSFVESDTAIDDAIRGLQGVFETANAGPSAFGADGGSRVRLEFEIAPEARWLDVQHTWGLATRAGISNAYFLDADSPSSMRALLPVSLSLSDLEKPEESEVAVHIRATVLRWSQEKGEGCPDVRVRFTRVERDDEGRLGTTASSEQAVFRFRSPTTAADWEQAEVGARRLLRPSERFAGVIAVPPQGPEARGVRYRDVARCMSLFRRMSAYEIRLEDPLQPLANVEVGPADTDLSVLTVKYGDDASIQMQARDPHGAPVTLGTWPWPASTEGEEDLVLKLGRLFGDAAASSGGSEWDGSIGHKLVFDVPRDVPWSRTRRLLEVALPGLHRVTFRDVDSPTAIDAELTQVANLGCAESKTEAVSLDVKLVHISGSSPHTSVGLSTSPVSLVRYLLYETARPSSPVREIHVGDSAEDWRPVEVAMQELAPRARLLVARVSVGVGEPGPNHGDVVRAMAALRRVGTRTIYLERPSNIR